MDNRDKELEALEAKHLDEASTDAQRSPIDFPRMMRIQHPSCQALPQSNEWLERLYAGDRMPREKKPMVFDHMRSWGPWMVSVDAEPMSVLDGMSQTATLNSGFASDGAVRAYFDGSFDGLLVRSPDSSIITHPMATKYAHYLGAQTPEIDKIAFTNSGAEANEKALALCKLNANNSAADTVLAFEGSFHGRTLQALHATWNPKKRTPYELDGFRAIFAPFPATTSTKPSDAAVSALLRACDVGDADAMQNAAQIDPCLQEEADSLRFVNDALRGGTIYALIIEPMQSEGGDRYGVARFYQALRRLTRYHKVSMILDEVQTGFGLGGPYSWGLGYNLVDKDGRPDNPDAMTWAKRAQVGFVNSRFIDPEPTSAHVASMVRGLSHCQSIGDGAHAAWVEEYVNPRLNALPNLYPGLVQGTRQRGYAFAFDLPTPELMSAYIKQRFWRGAVVFAAGTRTIRYRLSDAYGAREIDQLFETIQKSLDWLSANGPAEVPSWEEMVAVRPKQRNEIYRTRPVTNDEKEVVLETILRLESAVYEPARRDTRETLSIGLNDPYGVAIVAEVKSQDGWVIVGSALAGPLEAFRQIEGPDQDQYLGQNNTAYSMAITIHPDHQGAGLGAELKQAQLKQARALKTTEGENRYRWMTGRNRVGLADSMTHLNRMFGAYEDVTLSGQYGEQGAKAIYYRIPLQGYKPGRQDPIDRRPFDWNGVLSQPLASPPQALVDLRDQGGLFGPAVTKITVCNYITPAIVRAVEWVTALNADYPHLYLTSCRDELVDKTIRTLKHHRKDGVAAIGLKGGYVGHTSAGCRALSDQAVHSMGSAARSWPLVDHPSQVGVTQMLTQLEQSVAEIGSKEAVLGLFVEPVQERTGAVLSDEAWTVLEQFRADTGIPIVSVETASAAYRCQTSPFATDTGPGNPDIRVWWPGGQTGFIHLKQDYFVPNPLTMVSTWDGDELSMIRVHYQMMELRRTDSKPTMTRLAEYVDSLAGRGITVQGQGAYYVLHMGEQANTIINLCKRRGLSLRGFKNGGLVLSPPLDITAAELEAALRILDKALDGADSI